MMPPSAKRVMVADITAPGRGVGFSDLADVDFLITREDATWIVYETTVGTLRSTGRTAKQALKAFAKKLDLTGTIELCWETQRDRVEVFEI